MPKSFLRIVAFLLVPCLAGDPVTASACSRSLAVGVPLNACQPFFCEEALSGSSLSFAQRLLQLWDQYQFLHRSKISFESLAARAQELQLAGLLDYLKQMGNRPEDIEKAFLLLSSTSGSLLIEPACGHAKAAYAIAKAKPHIRVIAFDRFATDYDRALIATNWKKKQLSAQLRPLENLVVLRGDMKLLGFLPENSSYELLVNNPDVDIDKVLLMELAEMLHAGKLPPERVEIIIKPWFGEHSVTSLFKEPYYFEARDNYVHGVNLNSLSATNWDTQSFEGKDLNAYVLKKRAPVRPAPPASTAKSTGRKEGREELYSFAWPLAASMIDIWLKASWVSALIAGLSAIVGIWMALHPPPFNEKNFNRSLWIFGTWVSSVILVFYGASVFMPHFLSAREFLIIVASVLIHEAGHYIAARCLGIEAKFVPFKFAVDIDSIELKNRPLFQQFLVRAAGAAAQSLFGAAFLFFPDSAPLAKFIIYCAGLNLLPMSQGFLPFDGMRILGLFYEWLESGQKPRSDNASDTQTVAPTAVPDVRHAA